MAVKQLPNWTEAISTAWLSVRGEYASSGPRDDSLHGLGWLLFGIGCQGAAWLDRLRHSEWFAGLQPRTEDIAGGEVLSGTWTMPGDADCRELGAYDVHAELCVASAALPQTRCVAVAVPDKSTRAETLAALGLVRALKRRQDLLGRRLDVVVTLDGVQDAQGSRTRQFREAGAFVVCGDPARGVGGDHLHHFPLRATTRPREGRLICVDLADYLHTWRSDRTATLQVLPFGAQPEALTVRGCALNILVSPEPDLPAVLERINGYAAHCAELLTVGGGDNVVTTAERLDRAVGLVDVLVIHDEPGAGEA